MADHSRDPCPIVILSDFGGAFSMGVSIKIFHYILHTLFMICPIF